MPCSGHGGILVEAAWMSHRKLKMVYAGAPWMRIVMEEILTGGAAAGVEALGAHGGAKRKPRMKEIRVPRHEQT